MSDSKRTDRRKISKMFVLILSFAVSLSTHLPAFADSSGLPDSSGLLDGLAPLNIGPQLGSEIPSEIVVAGGLNEGSLAKPLFDLVQYMLDHTDTLTPEEILASVPKYRRVQMFGTWVNEDAPQDCYNTRAEVLLRDQSGTSQIEFSTKNPCLVARGEWHDPYTNTAFKLASAIDVDHVVPLKNAYRSGAHAWSNERRCHYANYMLDAQHLLAVSGHENKTKGDSGPEDYTPPDQTYLCAYITNWMRIKANWNLNFSDAEKMAIQKELRDNSCPVTLTRPPLADIQKSRIDSTIINTKCTEISDR